MKLISFVIPAYNEEHKIRRCLDSIIIQNSAYYEIILVNDGSSDQTLEIMKLYEEKYSFIKVVTYAQNRGLSAARNAGLEKASGRYIWFVDADDYTTENSVDELCNIIKADDLDCVYFMWDNLKDGVKEITPQRYDLSDISEEQVFSGYELFEKLTDRLPHLADSVCRCIINHSFIKKNNLRFKEGVIAEDGIFGISIYLFAKRIRHLLSSYYVYCFNSTSISNASNSVFECACRYYEYYSFLRKGMQFISDDRFKEIYAKNLKRFYSIVQGLMRNISDYRVLYRSIKSIDAEAASFFLMQNDSIGVELEGKTHIDILNEETSFLIYGAGVRARELALLLDKHDKRILSYVVSDDINSRISNPKNIFGVPVIKLSNISEFKKSTPIIVTVRESIRAQISDTLKEKGYSRILFY